METTSANPPRLDHEKLIHTRLMRTKLAPAHQRPLLLSRVLAAFRRRIELGWRALKARIRRAPKLLVVAETVALGDRRIVSVVQFERERFLIGCGPSSVTLLARLPDAGATEAAPADARPADCVPDDGGSR